MATQKQQVQSSPHIPAKKFSGNADLPSRNTNVVKLGGTVDNIGQSNSNQLHLGNSTTKMQQNYSSNALPIANGVLLNMNAGGNQLATGSNAAAPGGQYDPQGRPYNQGASGNPGGRGSNARYQQNSQQARSNNDGLFGTGNVQAMNATYQSRPGYQGPGGGSGSAAQIGSLKAGGGKANLGGGSSGSQGPKYSQNPQTMTAVTGGSGAYQSQVLQNQKINFQNQKKFLNQMGKASTKNSQNTNTSGSQHRTGK